MSALLYLPLHDLYVQENIVILAYAACHCGTDGQHVDGLIENVPKTF